MQHIPKFNPTSHWTMAELTQKNRQATIVWFGLLRMYDRTGQAVMAVSREQIAAECGLQTEFLNNISEALTVLKKAGWLFVERSSITKSDGTFRTVLRLFLQFSSQNAFTGALAGNRPRLKEHSGTFVKKENKEKKAVEFPKAQKVEGSSSIPSDFMDAVQPFGDEVPPIIANLLGSRWEEQYKEKYEAADIKSVERKLQQCERALVNWHPVDPKFVKNKEQCAEIISERRLIYGYMKS